MSVVTWSWEPAPQSTVKKGLITTADLALKSLLFNWWYFQKKVIWFSDLYKIDVIYNVIILHDLKNSIIFSLKELLQPLTA